MIMFFRKLSESWIAKVLMVFLAISMMSVFGLGSLPRLWGKNDNAIKVGSTVIPPRQLISEFDKELQKMRTMSGGRYVSPQDAIKMGLIEAVVQQDVSRLLAFEMTEKLGTIASDDAVRNYIVNNPNFQTISGAFDRNLFVSYLDRLHMNENQFANALKQELAQRHVHDAIAGIVEVPMLLAEKMYVYEKEQRDMAIVLVKPSNVKVTTQPSEQDLRDYYDAMHDDLYAPEYRTLSVVTIMPEDVAKEINVSDDVLRAAYAEQKDSLGKKERREVKQILIADEAKATALQKTLTAANFDKTAMDQFQMTDNDIHMGWVEKDGILPELADAVFTAKKGEVVGPLETPFGHQFVVVTNIEKAETVSYDRIKPDLLKSARAEKAYELLYQKSKALDDKIGAGESLEQAVRELNLPMVSNVEIDINGLGRNGKENTKLTNPSAIQSAFLTPRGEASTLIENGDGFILVRVDEIESMSLRPFESVKAQLKAEWIKDQQEKGVSDLADRVWTAAQKGDEMKTLALFNNLEEKKLEGLTRAGMQALPKNIVAELFNAPLKKVILLPIDNGFVLAKVTKIKTADPKANEMDVKLTQLALSERVENGLNEEIMGYYADKVGVKVDTSLIEKTFSVYKKAE